MLQGKVSFSLETYENVLARHPELGDAHLTLLGGEMWYSDAEQATVDARSMEELRRLGFTSGDRVSADLYDVMVVLQRPGIEYYTFASINGRSITARTAALGRDAVLAVSDGEMLSLYPVKVEQLAQALVWSLPETPPANVLSMSCAEADYQAIARGEMLPPGGSAHDAKRVKPWLLAERINVGQLYCAVRDGSGGRRRNERPPFWIDTESGRILVAVDAGGWITVQGAHAGHLATKLHQLEAECRGR